MTKKGWLRVLTGFIMVFTAAVISLGALTVSWFLGPNVYTKDEDYLDGDIGLRNYFYSGNGTQSKPFEIVSPIHFYNLTRLQNLGIFPEKKYFQIGHEFVLDGVRVMKCINEYDEEGNPIYADYLDMNEFSHDPKYKVMTIGGEGAPFYGEINGNGFPIKNLKISGNPEDIGVFGYVAHGGSLTGLVFDNLEVVSLGYNNTEGAPDNDLFSEDIDDIFNSSSYLATDTSLALYTYDSGTGSYVANNLKKLNGVSGTQLLNINSDESLVPGTDYFNGYFKPTFPAIEGDRFTYSIRSSSPLIREVGTLNLNGHGDTDVVIDLHPLAESELFNSGSNMQADAKLYLVASVEVDGFVFSRVIQSYTIEFYSNGHVYAEKQYGAGIFCDYIIQEDPTDHNTHYHHGNNIGLVAGHVDGNLQDCYVYNGRFSFNETGYHPIAAETDTALIGEIGTNVANSMDPELGLVVNGDIGVMNFSKIYKLIRDDFTPGQVVKAGQFPDSSSSTKKYLSYKEAINQETYGNFKEYLRYKDGEYANNEFITGTSGSVGSGSDPVWHDYTIPNNMSEDYNSVDFLWNKVIQDEEDVDRGLGVFKVVSSYNNAAKTGAYGTYMVDNIGESRIINGNPKTKVYFSTAELDHKKDGNYWKDVATPFRQTTLPSYSDINSFEHQFSRDFNYVFELDLSQMDQAAGKDYMYNTDSPFLTNYLASRLIDKHGAPVTPGSARFGFMFRSSENEILSSLSSYMPVNVPGSKQPFEVDGQTMYYPSKSIVFSIDNPNGANVSVVGNGGDICVYEYDPTKSSGGTTALYSMRSSNVSDTDSHRYFTYDVTNGATSTECVPNGNGMSDGGALYGHIFKLKQGNYVLGAREGSAKVYFLAVQGQTEGTLGDNDLVAIGDAVENVDFITEAPTIAAYPDGFAKALFSFKGTFNLTSGTVYMEVVTVSTKKYMKIRFATDPTFVTYILTYSRHTEHTYYINDTVIDTVNYTYTV